MKILRSPVWKLSKLTIPVLSILLNFVKVSFFFFFGKSNTVPPHHWITKNLSLWRPQNTQVSYSHRLQSPGTTTTLLTRKTHQLSPDKFLYSCTEIWSFSPLNLTFISSIMTILTSPEHSNLTNGGKNSSSKL